MDTPVNIKKTFPFPADMVPRGRKMTQDLRKKIISLHHKGERRQEDQQSFTY